MYFQLNKFRRNRDPRFFIKDHVDHRSSRHHEAHKKHRRKDRQLKFIILGLAILLCILGSASYFLYRNIKQKTASSSDSLQTIVEAKNIKDLQRTVESKYGISAQYNTDLVSASGSITDNGAYIYVTPPELYQKDNYAGFRFELNDTLGFDESLSRYGHLSGPELWVNTNTFGNFFEEGRKKYGQDKSDIDLVVSHFAPKETEESKPSLISQEDEVINGVNYKKIIYKVTDTAYITTDIDRIILYVTIQNGRPYAVSLNTTTLVQQGDLAPLMQILNSIKYSVPDSDAKFSATKLGFDNSHVLGARAIAAEQDSQDVLEENTNIPEKLKTGTDLTIVAKNQPAVVRIANQTCFDYNLLLPNKQPTMSIKDACGFGVGSGSIVSEDGYISTNGHVTVMKPSDTIINYLSARLQANDNMPINDYLTYLAQINVMSVSEIDNMIAGLTQNDETAINKFVYSAELIPKENYQVTDKRPEYAIQLGNDPIQFESPSQGSTRVSLEYNDNIVKAAFIDADFDEYNTQEGKSDLMNSTASDVAILKIENQGSFPNVNLGEIGSLREGSLVTAIGFPAFVDLDEQLVAKKDKTVPSATQGEVQGIFDDSTGPNPRKLIATNALGAQGNSGGPAFDESGNVIGLLTYGGDPNDSEAGVSKFSASAILRDVADYKNLLDKNGITLDTESDINNDWNKAIDEFLQARFKASQELFKKVKSQYPANYLAQAFIDASQAKIDSGEDVSTESTLSTALAGIFVVVAIGAGVTVIVFVKHRRHGKSMGYNAALPPMPPAPQTQAYPQYPSPQVQASTIISPNNPSPSQQNVNPTVAMPQVIDNVQTQQPQAIEQQSQDNYAVQQPTTATDNIYTQNGQESVQPAAINQIQPENNQNTAIQPQVINPHPTNNQPVGNYPEMSHNQTLETRTIIQPTVNGQNLPQQPVNNTNGQTQPPPPAPRA